MIFPVGVGGLPIYTIYISFRETFEQTNFRMTDYLNQLFGLKKDNSDANFHLERSDLQKAKALRSAPQNSWNWGLAQGNASTKTGPISQIPHLQQLGSLELAKRCVNNAIANDNDTPSLDEIAARFPVDNYNFDPTGGNNVFSRFEKTSIFSIPDSIYEELSQGDCNTNMGMLPEIAKAWISVDNKLFIWNCLGGSTQSQPEFFTVEEIKNCILSVKVVRPKEKVFVDQVNYLLLVSTVMDIHILAVEYDDATGKLDIFNTGMSVPAHNLNVKKFVTFNASQDIFFYGESDGTNIWRLSYSNSEEMFHRKCSKECLTRSGMSNIVPSGNLITKLPGFGFSAEESSANKVESIKQMEIDQSRGILYTLSSKSVIRAYKLKSEKGSTLLKTPTVYSPSDILKELSTTTVSLRSALLEKDALVINSIHVVTSHESDRLYLVAVTGQGCRIFINGSSISSITLRSNFLKFPPAGEEYYKKLQSEKETMLAQQKQQQKQQQLFPLSSVGPTLPSPQESAAATVALKNAQEASTLLRGLKLSVIVSPGIYFGVLSGEKSDRLFVSTPDYGMIKHSQTYVEDFEFLASAGTIYGIVQLTSSFNATDTPKGYFNEFASQYVKPVLELAVLTDTGIHVYTYRTPDVVLESSLNDATFKEFANKYGAEEACSTALFLSCKYGKTDSFRDKCTQLFILGGANPRIDKNLTVMVDNVELSDRFVAICLLISRMFRKFWDKEVFCLDSAVKMTKDGYVDEASLKELNSAAVLTQINVEKIEIEYILSSILIMLDFFERNKNNIPGFLAPNFSYNPSNDKDHEVCLQAEHIGLKCILALLNNMKEGLSFLGILLEESEAVEDGKPTTDFKEFSKFVALQSQIDLSCLTFGEFFASTDPKIQKLIRDLLSALINKSISRGISVDFIASTLQERCGAFCSTGEVVVFKAIESLKKAKDMAKDDDDLKVTYMQSAVKLFEQAADSLNPDIIKDAIKIMVELNYDDGAIDLLLRIANNTENGKLALQYTPEVALHDPKQQAYENRIGLYSLIFEILTNVEQKSTDSVQSILKSATATFSLKGPQFTRESRLCDDCYSTCFAFPDKMFHCELYRWFLRRGMGEKLLEVDTSYILPFLEANAFKDLQMSEYLWIYQSKRERYYSAAQILYNLAISQFPLSLGERIQYLSRASGFSHCTCPPNVRQEMSELSVLISDYMTISSIQDELLSKIKLDGRVSQEALKQAQEQLDGPILSASDLFNDYVDPLGYYDLALLIFKVSDHRDPQDIVAQWKMYLAKLQSDCEKKEESEQFYGFISSKFVVLARKLSDNDVVFPIEQVFEMITKCVYGKSTAVIPPVGVIVDLFIKSGIPYDKLYYALKDMIECTSFEVFPGYKHVLNTEMAHLIQMWFTNEKRLKNILSVDVVRKLEVYDVNNDPIDAYTKQTGIPI